MILNVEDALHLIHFICEVFRLFKRAVGLQGSLAVRRIGEFDGEVVAYLINEDDSLLVEPLHTASVLPQSILDAALGVIDVGSEAVLLALVPPALVFAAVGPVVDAEAFFLIHEVLAIVAHTISIDVDAVALHIVRLPLAVVLTTILPKVHAVAINLVVEPLAFVG